MLSVVVSSRAIHRFHREASFPVHRFLALRHRLSHYVTFASVTGSKPSHAETRPLRHHPRCHRRRHHPRRGPARARRRLQRGRRRGRPTGPGQRLVPGHRAVVRQCRHQSRPASLGRRPDRLRGGSAHCLHRHRQSRRAHRRATRNAGGRYAGLLQQLRLRLLAGRRSGAAAERLRNRDHGIRQRADGPEPTPRSADHRRSRSRRRQSHDLRRVRHPVHPTG